jgi:hypothetical protein
MALRHGNKTYFQILLDPHRAELLQLLAKEESIRATAWIRDVLYERIEEDCGATAYAAALDKDKATWKTSIENRVAGRNSRKAATEQNTTEA